MAYTPNTWVKGDTISSAKMNNIEDGISQVDALVDNIQDAISDLEAGSLSAVGADAGAMPVADGNGSWEWAADPLAEEVSDLKSAFGAFTATWTSGKTLNKNTGAEANQSSYSASNFLPLYGPTLSFTTRCAPNDYAAVAFYDENKAFISGVTNGTSGYTYTDSVSIPSTAYYCRFSCITDYIASTFAYSLVDLKSIAGTLVDLIVDETANENAIALEVSHVEDVTRNKSLLTWELGAVASSGVWTASSTRMRTIVSHKMLKGTIISCDSGYQFRVYQYNGYVDQSMNSATITGKYVGATSWSTSPYTLLADNWYILLVSTTSDTAPTGTETHITIKENVAVNEIDAVLPTFVTQNQAASFATDDKIATAVEALEVNTEILTWEAGAYNASTGEQQTSTVRVRTKNLIHLPKGTKLYVDANYMYRIFRYSENSLSSFVEYYEYNYDSTLHWITGYYEIPADAYYGLCASDYAGSTVTDAEAVGAHIHVEPYIALNELKSAVSLGIMPYNLTGLKSYIETVAGMGGDVVLSLVTDIHGGYPDTYDVINYLANSGVGNYMFEMGDIIKSTFPTRAEAVAYLRESFHTMAYTATNTPIIFLQGNHDTNPLSGTDTSKNVTQETFYGLSMARSKNVKQPVQKAYGYVDIDSAKVRVIYLNTSDIYNATTGDALVTGKYTMIQQGQLDWFTGTALNLSDKDTPTDWSVIIVSHDSLSQIAGSAFDAILTAFMTGATASGTQTVTVDTYSNVLTYNCDFTAQGGIDVICEVNGHHHKDMIRELGTTGIQQVYVACEGPASASYDDDGETVYYTRNRGTTDEHLIDTLVLDKANRKVYFKRFGVGEDREITY